DLLEQQFWLDPTEGMRYLLPFMIAASIYQRDINQDIFEVAAFFERYLSSQPFNWWQCAGSLVYTMNSSVSEEELASLQALAKLVPQRSLTFPCLAHNYSQELEAALWWRLGEAYADVEDAKALQWYEKALTRLGQATELKEEAATTAFKAAYQLNTKKKYDEAIFHLNRAIELNPLYAYAYYERGYAHYQLRKCEQAITDYDRALELDPLYAYAYGGRGYAYSDLKEYGKAFADYNQALELDPSAHWAYYGRGYTYTDLKEHEQAITNYNRALELNPSYALAYYSRGITYLHLRKIALARDDCKRSLEFDPADITTAWMIEWVEMNKQRADEKTAERLATIVTIEPEDYIAYLCRGVALGLRGKGKAGLEGIEKAISLEPIAWSAYFWKGMLLLYYYRKSAQDREAIAAIEQSLDLGLPPVLLTPLYWFERDRPDLFEREIRPLLARYGV